LVGYIPVVSKIGLVYGRPKGPGCLNFARHHRRQPGGYTLEKGHVRLLESVTAKPETGTLRLHFRTCILTDEELEMARTTEDPD
jgi:hypothetical protein